MKKVELIDRKVFVAAILDKNKEIFVIDIVTLLAAPTIIIHFF